MAAVIIPYADTCHTVGYLSRSPRRSGSTCAAVLRTAFAPCHASSAKNDGRKCYLNVWGIYPVTPPLGSHHIYTSPLVVGGLVVCTSMFTYLFLFMYSSSPKFFDPF